MHQNHDHYENPKKRVVPAAFAADMTDHRNSDSPFYVKGYARVLNEMVLFRILFPDSYEMQNINHKKAPKKKER